MPDEAERSKLIGEITRVLSESEVPESTRMAGLTLIGWLARRREDEPADDSGVREARISERRMRTVARAKAR